MTNPESTNKGPQAQPDATPSSPTVQTTPLASGKRSTLDFAATSQLEAEPSYAKGKRRDTGPSIPEFYTPLPRRYDDAPASSDDETSVVNWTNMESKLVIIWSANNITKQRRQDWILQRAESAVEDYEIKFKSKFPPHEREDIVIATVKCLAEQCAKAKALKESSRASTPVGNTYVEVARTSTGIQPVDYSHDLGTPRPDNREVHFEAGGYDRSNPIASNDQTQIIPPPDSVNDADWDKRMTLTLRRAGELALFGYSRTPEQGILFDGATPIDEWKYPSDGRRIRGRDATRPREMQTGSGNSTPPPVPSKDNMMPSRQHTSMASRSPFNPPTNTQYVTNQRGILYGNNVMLLSPINSTRIGTQTRPPDHGYNQGNTPMNLAPGIRSFRGYDMPSMSAPPGNLTGLQGIHQAKENHQANMKDRLSKIIDDALGRELLLPDGYKPSFKGDRGEPKKYGGSAKMVDLEDWLSAITNRFALQKLGGERPEIDKIRVMLLLDCLEGTAYKWMLRHVTHVNRNVEHWTFRDVIHGLYTRFVHPSSMQDARESLNKVEYSQKEGIQGLYDSMQEHAGGMAVYPDDYTMLAIFLGKIPPYMMTELLNTRGLTPEVNTLSEFVANAIDVEQRRRNEEYYRDMRTRGTSTRTPKGGSKARIREMDAKPIDSKDDRPMRYNNGQNNNRTYGRSRRGPTQAKIQDKTNDHAPQKHDKPKQQWTKKPFKKRENHSNNKGCYNCASLDHFSRDCPKPRQNRTFVRAARSANDSGSDNDGEYESMNDEDEDGIRRMSDISERDENENHDSDERIEIEVPTENEYYEDNENEDRMFGMRTSPETPETELGMEDEETAGEVKYEVDQDFVTATIVFPLKGNETTKEVKMRKHKLIPSRRTRPRPTYTNEEKKCLATWVEINGLRAWTLWDSGSTTTGITPALAELARIPVDELEDPHVLQLGTVGSRSTIKYGADIDINVNGEKMSLYVDIANFDRYEMIIGTPFMRRNKVLLDFDKNEVVVRGKRIQAVTVSSKDLDLVTRRQRTTDKKRE